MVSAAAVLAALAAYYALSDELPALAGWWDVAVLALLLLPAAFVLVWLALPAWRTGTRVLAAAALALGAVTAALEVLGLDIAANFVKFAAVVALAWWFLTFFEAVTWTLLVAVLIVPVDIVSVARGPTREIVEHQPEVFDALSIAFPLPGESSSAQLGLPDVLFFALFLAAADRFGLRVAWTWTLMTLSFGVTLALASWTGAAGLPALPLLSAAFVVANADRLWRAVRAR